MRDDPCFACRLPDCDDRSERCRVRQLKCSYDAKIRRGEHAQITAVERVAMNRIFKAWELERLAEASEGGRPYHRRGPANAVSP
jgi:hypothetical protein